jgi:hypothetical protein
MTSKQGRKVARRVADQSQQDYDAMIEHKLHRAGARPGTLAEAAIKIQGLMDQEDRAAKKKAAMPKAPRPKRSIDREARRLAGQRGMPHGAEGLMRQLLANDML